MTKTQLSKQLQIINHNLFAAKADNTLTLIYEKELAKAVSALFKKMQEEILENLREYYTPGIMLKAHIDLILAPIHEYHKAYYDIIMKYKNREHKKGYVQGKRLVTRAKQYAKNYSKSYVKQNGALKADEIKFPMKQIIKQQDVLFGTSDFSAEMMANKTFIASQNTLKRVDGDINEIITDGYQDGKGINDVTKRINKRFGQLKSWESQRIARTEIHGSHMQGIMKSYEEMGVEYTQWASAHDTRVRGLKPGDKADHVKMDGEIIAWGGTYSNGLRYPGDTSGRIAEWINCRCGNIPWFCPPGYAVPSGVTHFREEDLIPTLDKWQSPENLLKENTPSLIKDESVGKHINIDELWISPDGPNQGEYLIDELDGPILKNPKTGKYEFNGLELHDFDEEGKFGYVTHEEVLAHNAKIKKASKKISQSTYIDPDTLHESTYYKGTYIIDETDGPILKNPKTGKYEFNGLEIDYDPEKNFAYVPKVDIDAHNANVLGKPIEKEYIDTDKLYKSASTLHKDTYFIASEDGLIIKNPKTGKYTFKGLEIDYDPKKDVAYVPIKDVEKHNVIVSKDAHDVVGELIGVKPQSRPSKEHIQIEHMVLADDAKTFKVDLILDDLKIVEDKAYYKGLHVKNYDPDLEEGTITLQEIKAHNASLVKDEFDKYALTPDQKAKLKKLSGNVFELSDVELDEWQKLDMQNDINKLYNKKIKEGLSEYETKKLDALKKDLKDNMGVDLDKIAKKDVKDDLDKYALTGNQKIKLKEYSKIESDELTWDEISELNKLSVQDKLNKLHNQKIKEGLSPYKQSEYDDLIKVSKEFGLDLDQIARKPKNQLINTADLTPAKHQYYDSYIVDDGIEFINGKFYYKGIEVHDYDVKQKVGYIYKHEIDKYNHDLVFGDIEIPSFVDAKEVLSPEEFQKFEDLKENLDWVIGVQTSEVVSKSGKKMALEKLDDNLSEFKDLVKKVNKKSKSKLSFEEIDALDIDSDGDYIIDDTIHVKLNKNTNEYEYKGVPLADYDPDDREGYIEKEVMEQYMRENNIRDSSYFNSKVLTEKEIDGEKFVVDTDGRKWVIDNDREYERLQDSIQNTKANEGMGLYTEYEKHSTTHWGRFGHQPISNLIYGDSDYTDYYKYSTLMEEQLTPLLNKMKDKYKIIADETVDPEIAMKAIDDYKILEKDFAKKVEKIKDPEVQNILWEIKDLDSTIIKSPRLAQNTAFVRYGNFDEDMCQVGEVFDIDGFLSTSYDDITYQPEATDHFASKAHRWKIIVLAPEGTEGVRLNNYFNALTTEREWLLQRNQKFEVLEYGTVSDAYNPRRKTVTIRLLDPRK